MGLSHAPRVITDGLVLGLDAANTRSYVGSGTTWTDLIGSNNGTLTNGPVFTQEPKLEPFGGAGAVSFDGSGDYLTNTYTTSAFDWYTTDIDFTIECWFYANSLSGTSYSGGPGIDHPTLIGNRDAASVSDYWSFGPTSDGKVAFYYYKGSETMVKSSTSITANSWNHISMTKTSLGITLFVNGLSQSASAIVGTPQSGGALPLTIGQGNGTAFNGYISNLRIVKGTALYTSNFTPKRQPLIPESAPNTVLLTCQKGTIRDRSPSAHAITINGDAKSISGASYFEFDGTDDYVIIGSSPYTGFGTGDFTIEAWVYLTDDTVQNNGIYDCRYSASATGPLLYYIPTTGLLMFYNGSNTIIGGTIPLNTWTHVAMVRLSGSTRLYIDTEQVGSTYADTNNYTSGVNNGVIGAVYNGTGVWNGNISTVKVYNNKGLTAAEVKQNYRNTKSRYGL